MTHKIFFISDTHFGHNNILNFTQSDGKPVREFSSMEEMNETMIANWNNVVRPQDKVYHLGDVVINRKYLELISRLNGKKRLIRGNHDIFKTEDYLKYFDEIYGVRVFSKEKLICSHIPIDIESMYRWTCNVHGHLHTNNKMLNKNQKHPMYFNVSVEQINYTPIELDELMEKISDRQRHHGNYIQSLQQQFCPSDRKIT